MNKFSIARRPYYVTMIVYMGFVALIALINSTITHGFDSDFHLIVLLAALVLCGLSVMYMFTIDAGQDDEVNAEVAGLPISKTAYYIGILVVAAYRAYAGYEQNHSHEGARAFLGVVWVIASLAVALFTYANYKSFTTKNTVTKPTVP